MRVLRVKFSNNWYDVKYNDKPVPYSLEPRSVCYMVGSWTGRAHFDLLQESEAIYRTGSELRQTSSGNLEAIAPPRAQRPQGCPNWVPVVTGRHGVGVSEPFPTAPSTSVGYWLALDRYALGAVLKPAGWVVLARARRPGTSNSLFYPAEVHYWQERSVASWRRAPSNARGTRRIGTLDNNSGSTPGNWTRRNNEQRGIVAGLPADKPAAPAPPIAALRSGMPQNRKPGQKPVAGSDFAKASSGPLLLRKTDTRLSSASGTDVPAGPHRSSAAVPPGIQAGRPQKPLSFNGPLVRTRALGLRMMAVA